MTSSAECTMFLDALGRRLDKGSQVYGDLSFTRPILQTIDEIDAELLDQVGWLFVLWGQAARRACWTSDAQDLRVAFLTNMKRRIEADDVRLSHVLSLIPSSRSMAMIEVMALEMYRHRRDALEQLRLVRFAMDSEQRAEEDKYRARRGSTRSPRMDD